MNRATPFTAAIAAALALLAALAAPIFVGHVYVADDLGEFHLPLRAFYAKQLAADEPFDWCPDLYCGFYLTGEGQVGGYHPLHLLLYRTMPLSIAFDFECWLSYPAMLVGMAMFLRRWRLTLSAAAFGATVFAFGSFNFLHFVHPNAVAVVAHLPWLLWAMDVMLRSPNARHRGLAFTAVAALTASQWLLGYPQYVAYSLGVEIGYLLYIIALSNANGAAGAVVQTLRWLAAVALGTLIGGIQLLPTIDALQHSVRQSPTSELADLGSLHPLNLIQLVGPYLFENRVAGQNTHELAIYLGAAPLVLAMFGAMHGMRQRRYRPLTIAALVAATLSIMWALGSFGPFEWLQTHAPLISKFRLPCRAIVVFQLAAAVLAAIGFAILCHQSRSTEPCEASSGIGWLWPLPAASAAAAAAAPALWPDYTSAWPSLLFGPAAIALAVGLVSLAHRGSSWTLQALLVLTAIDLGLYGMSYAVFGKTMPLREFVEETSAPPVAADSRVVLDSLAGVQIAPGDGGQRLGNRILLKGWKRADGYAGLEPARQLDYREPVALQLAGVGWKLNGNSQNARWQPITDYRPRAWLVTQATVSARPALDLESLPSAEQALLDVPLSLAAASPGQVVVHRDRPGDVSVKTTCPTSQLLLVNESFHPGWKVTVDGEKASVLRANGDFLGVVAPAGPHEIHLQFRPSSLEYGRMASGCGLSLLVAALLFVTRPSSQQSSPPDASPPIAIQR